MSGRKDAHSFYRQALARKDYISARLYLINAITHQCKIEYLEDYVKLLKILPAADVANALEQAWNIFTLAIYNCEAEDVERVRVLLEDIKNFQELSLQSNVEAEKNIERKMEEIKTALNFYSWTNMRQQGLLEDVSALNNKAAIFKEALELNLLDDKQLEEISSELQELEIYNNFLASKIATGQYLQQISEELNKSRYSVNYIVARLQQTNATLSQLWLCDVSSIIGTEQYMSAMSELQKNYSALEQDFFYKEAEKVVYEIKQDFKHIKSLTEVTASEVIDSRNQFMNTKGDLTKALEKIQLFSDRVNSKINCINSAKAIQEMQQILTQTAEVASILAKRRYARYQYVCALWSKQAIQAYNNAFTVYGSDAKYFLQQYHITIISEALLAPETASILQTAKSTLSAKLSKDDKVSFDVDCVNDTKFTLENL